MKKSLLAGHRENLQQLALKKEYNIEKDVVVVEKRSTAAQLLRVCLKTFYKALNIFVNIAILLLAAIGLAALIYPEIRTEFFNVLNKAVVEIKSYF